MFQMASPIGYPRLLACSLSGNLLLNSKTFRFDTAYAPSQAQVSLPQDEKGAAAGLHLARAASFALERVQHETHMYHHHRLNQQTMGMRRGLPNIINGFIQIQHDPAPCATRCSHV